MIHRHASDSTQQRDPGARAPQGGRAAPLHHRITCRQCRASRIPRAPMGAASAGQPSNGDSARFSVNRGILIKNQRLSRFCIRAAAGTPPPLQAPAASLSGSSFLYTLAGNAVGGSFQLHSELWNVMAAGGRAAPYWGHARTGDSAQNHLGRTALCAPAATHARETAWAPPPTSGRGPTSAS